MIESGFIVEIVVVDCWISTISAVSGDRLYGVCRGFWKYVLLSSPCNLEFVNSTTNSGRGSCWVCLGFRYGHILIIASIYGTPFRASGSCSPSDRNPHCASAPSISVFFLDRHS